MLKCEMPTSFLQHFPLVLCTFCLTEVFRSHPLPVPVSLNRSGYPRILPRFHPVLLTDPKEGGSATKQAGREGSTGTEVKYFRVALCPKPSFRRIRKRTQFCIHISTRELTQTTPIHKSLGKMQPFTCSMLSFLAILSLCLPFNFTIISATSRFRLETSLDTNATDTDFIKASCETTRYPDLCYKTLSPYATTIETNAMELANAALTVCLKSAKSTSKGVRELLNGRDLSMRDGQVIVDCLENMSDYVDEMKKSMVEMKDLDGPNFNEKMGNLKTWVSAALTDEDTCMDGFQEDSVVKNVKMKETIRGYIVNVAELTSNALALITNIS